MGGIVSFGGGGVGNIPCCPLCKKKPVITMDCLYVVFPHDVPTWIETLEEQFVVLHDRLVTELSERGVSVKKVLRALIVLPFAIRNEYINAIQSMLPDLAKRKVIVNLFHCLNPLFTFIDYKLLQHLVSKFGSIQLKQDMMSYVKEVNLFKKVTTINELIDYWPGLDVPQIDYKMLRTKFKDDPKSYTLEKLDYFRNRFFSKLRLSEFIAVSQLSSLPVCMCVWGWRDFHNKDNKKHSPSSISSTIA